VKSTTPADFARLHTQLCSDQQPACIHYATTLRVGKQPPTLVFRRGSVSGEVPAIAVVLGGDYMWPLPLFDVKCVWELDIRTGGLACC